MLPLIVLADVILIVGGILLLIFGILGLTNVSATFGLVDNNDLSKYIVQTGFELPKFIWGICVFMIVIGIFLLITSIVAGLLISKGEKHYAVLFLVLLAVAICLQIALITYASIYATYPDKGEAEIRKLADDNLKGAKQQFKYANNKFDYDYDQKSAGWQKLQIHGKCCGVASFREYSSNVVFDRHNIYNHSLPLHIPISCCKTKEIKELKNGTALDIVSFVNLHQCSIKPLDFINEQPCLDYFMNIAYKFSLIPIILCSILLFFEIIAVIGIIFLLGEFNA